MKKRRYASGQLGLTLVSESFGTYLAFFYLERLGLSAALYALARTVYALWDAVNDPLFGHLSDRTKTPWGRRRPRGWSPWGFWGRPWPTSPWRASPGGWGREGSSEPGFSSTPSRPSSSPWPQASGPSTSSASSRGWPRPWWPRGSGP